jgi:protein-L-isoaspartate(D-aspartate) O-methyltransferase
VPFGELERSVKPVMSKAMPLTARSADRGHCRWTFDERWLAVPDAADIEPLELELYYRHITAMTVQGAIPDFAAARAAMVESQLRPQGVTDPAVLDAMGSVERERFLPPETRPLAYVDRAVRIGEGRFLPAPAVLGELLMQMLPVRGQRALVVGAGTGYSAAVLAAMGLAVTALESSPELAAKARDNGIAIVEGPLDAGWKKAAPYDQILIDGAVEYIPDPIIEQLANGGRLGTALLDRGITRLVVGRKAGGAFGYLSLSDAGVPALPGFARPKAFTF